MSHWSCEGGVCRLVEDELEGENGEAAGEGASPATAPSAVSGSIFSGASCGRSSAERYTPRPGPLEKLRPLFMHCKCGKSFSYKTNLTAERVTHTCLACKAPVDLELNSRKTAYVTVGERR